MMTWEYRVFREENGDYVIREVFYDENGKIIGFTEDAVEPMGTSLRALTADLESFRAALKLPVMTAANIPPTSKPQNRAHRKNKSLEQVSQELGLGKPRPSRRRTPRKQGTKRVLAAAGKRK
jgi:hypothetical protein